jgi:hypothetical protein
MSAAQRADSRRRPRAAARGCRFDDPTHGFNGAARWAPGSLSRRRAVRVTISLGVSTALVMGRCPTDVLSHSSCGAGLTMQRRAAAAGLALAAIATSCIVYAQQPRSYPIGILGLRPTADLLGSQPEAVEAQPSPAPPFRSDAVQAGHCICRHWLRTHRNPGGCNAVEPSPPPRHIRLLEPGVE